MCGTLQCSERHMYITSIHLYWPNIMSKMDLGTGYIILCLFTTTALDSVSSTHFNNLSLYILIHFMKCFILSKRG